LAKQKQNNKASPEGARRHQQPWRRAGGRLPARGAGDREARRLHAGRCEAEVSVDMTPGQLSIIIIN